MIRPLLVVLLATSCGASGSQIATAAVASAVALTASGISRSTGGCYASCPTGTTCNSVTGLCDVLPCRGVCDEDQECDDTGPIAKCVAKKADIQITTEPR